MRLLYLSCHSGLEFDELRMFREIPGLEVFSPGAYITGEGDGLRPSLDLNLRQEWLDAWANVRALEGESGVKADQKANIPTEVLRLFDAVLIMHVPEWLESNWGNFKAAGIRVLWRDIGQTQPHQESMLQAYKRRGLEIVRYSERTQEIPHYAGGDALIPFGRYPKDFQRWQGKEPCVVTVAQDMKNRDDACKYGLFISNTEGFKRKLYGKNNEAAGKVWAGEKSYKDLMQVYRDNRVYFYTGTSPAPMTLNGIEALMAGIPIVCPTEAAIGYNHFDMPRILRACGLSYRVCRDGGFSQVLDILLKAKPEQLEEESARQRAYAEMAFSAKNVIPKWKEFLNA